MPKKNDPVTQQTRDNETAMRADERFEYSAIVDRKPLKLPRGVRLVVWPIVNVEVWDIGRPMPRQALPPPTGITRLPDVPHWAWHEYGNRVGFWRLKEALDRLKITPSLSVNARVCEDYPRIAQAAHDAGWEFMGHSYDQRPIHLEPDQRATIRKTVKVIKSFTGKPPVGWLGPGFTQTLKLGFTDLGANHHRQFSSSAGRAPQFRTGFIQQRRLDPRQRLPQPRFGQGVIVERQAALRVLVGRAQQREDQAL